MKYKLFLSDFDGTLVRADGTVSETNRAAIARYEEAGGIFAVCTGRMPASILPRVRELGQKGVVAAYQGAVLLDIPTGKPLVSNAFSEEDARKVLLLAEAGGYHTQIYAETDFYCNMDDDPLKLYEKICGVKAIVPNEPLLKLWEREKFPLVKVLLMVEEEQRDALADYCKKELGEKFYVTCSSKWFVEILPAGQNKGKAVEYLCKYYNIPAEETAAIGDALNDLDMLYAAGGKFAVENGEQALKEIAVTVASNEEDGVAEALMKYAMGEEK
ncbi:MAG: Cof-type HAD-IIB family hydrolase [Clostridiales bacterium]|nr:Cof-type HAD-IIB family hydrolase [Clostridiales bacterium]